MPTTPNPTPPDEDDGGPTVPSSPVDPPPPPTNPDEEWLVHRPNLLDRGVSYPRAEINYVEKFMTVTNKVSFFQSFPATQYPHPPMFDGVCPGHWSRQYPDMGAAAALASGSGYFGYVGTSLVNPDKWWSTNFVDDPVGEDLPATAVTSKGQYHSKNSALAAEENITALVIVSKDTVTLKWGSSWGLVTKNATYDRRAADGSIQPELHILPRSSDGSPDLEILEKTIMNKAPVTGSFVIVDFKRNSYVFTTVDGAYAQYTAIDEKNRPTRDTMPFEESPLPLTSNLTELPQFSQNVQVYFRAGHTVQINKDTSGLDYSHPWLRAFSGMDQNSNVAQGTLVSTLQSAQNQSGLRVTHLLGFSGGFLPFTEVMTWKDEGVPIDWYSGWLRTGSPTQMVGWFVNTKQLSFSSAGPSCRMFTSSYGYTSLAPVAIIDGKTTYDFQSQNIFDELTAVMYLGTNDGAVGFIYDASVGAYGQARFISQI